MHVCKHFEFILVAFATLVNAYSDKIITTNSPKSHNSEKNMHSIQSLSIVLVPFAYNAVIMLNAYAFLLCWHNRLKPSHCYSHVANVCSKMSLIP